MWKSDWGETVKILGIGSWILMKYSFRGLETTIMKFNFRSGFNVCILLEPFTEGLICLVVVMLHIKHKCSIHILYGSKTEVYKNMSTWKQPNKHILYLIDRANYAEEITIVDNSIWGNVQPFHLQSPSRKKKKKPSKYMIRFPSQESQLVCV